jgi:hypothetical protein
MGRSSPPGPPHALSGVAGFFSDHARESLDKWASKHYALNRFSSYETRGANVAVKKSAKKTSKKVAKKKPAKKAAKKSKKRK